jgi:hypothetical protein
MQTAKEHYDWCVKRAEEYLDNGDLENAFASFGSDMRKNPETEKVLINLMPLGLFEVMNGSVEGLRRFIKGFNF